MAPVEGCLLGTWDRPLHFPFPFPISEWTHCSLGPVERQTESSVGWVLDPRVSRIGRIPPRGLRTHPPGRLRFGAATLSLQWK